MKWSGWIVFSLASALAVALNAAEPRPVSPRLARVSVARYTGDDLRAPPTANVPATITPHAPVHYRLASWDIWSGTSTGYVYSPGACDHKPPCIDHLWDGYEQKPHRCDPIHMRGGCRGMHGCGAVSGCDSCGGHCSLLKRAHGWHFGGRVCGSGCSSCGSIAPSCAAPSCGYDAGSGKGAHDAPMPVDGPPVPMPEIGGDAPTVQPFPPLPEKAARGHRLRGFSWPESSLQR